VRKKRLRELNYQKNKKKKATTGNAGKLQVEQSFWGGESPEAQLLQKKKRKRGMTGDRKARSPQKRRKNNITEGKKKPNREKVQRKKRGPAGCRKRGGSGKED